LNPDIQKEEQAEFIVDRVYGYSKYNDIEIVESNFEIISKDKL